MVYGDCELRMVNYTRFIKRLKNWHFVLFAVNDLVLLPVQPFSGC